MGADLGVLWSPRSDSNRQPSDYETDTRRRSGRLQTDRLDDQMDDQGASDTESDGKASESGLTAGSAGDGFTCRRWAPEDVFQGNLTRLTRRHQPARGCDDPGACVKALWVRVNRWGRRSLLQGRVRYIGSGEGRPRCLPARSGPDRTLGHRLGDLGSSSQHPVARSPATPTAGAADGHRGQHARTPRGTKRHGPDLPGS
jgi:hypothetical protein